MLVQKRDLTRKNIKFVGMDDIDENGSEKEIYVDGDGIVNKDKTDDTNTNLADVTSRNKLINTTNSNNSSKGCCVIL